MSINNTKKENKRQAGVDLLRIIAVMMISTVHYLAAGILYNTEFGSFNTKIARVIESLAIVCVNLFILISGYFGITSKGFNLRRIINMIIMIAFFSGTSYVLYSLAGQNTFSVIVFIKSFVPYLFEGYWFIRVYLILSLLAPFLNIGLIKLKKSAYGTLLIICFVVFSLFPSFLDAFKNGNGLDIIHFVFMYAIGGYLKLHISEMPKPLFCFFGYLFFAVITFLFSIYGNGLGYWAYDFISVVPESICLFAVFIQLKFKNRFISYIAQSSLAVFVVENCIRGLYSDVMQVETYMESSLFLLYFAACIVGFTAFALSIDCIRRLIFKYTIDKLLDNIPALNKRLFVHIEITDN